MTAVLFITALSKPALAQQVKQYLLDDKLLYEIAVPYQEGTTTILFPTGDIQALRARHVMGNISKATEQKGDFLLNYEPASSYLNLTALRPDASDVLTVVYGNRAYLLHLKASTTPDWSVTFFQRQDGLLLNKHKLVSPARLLSILDQAKSYELFEKYHPEALAGVSRAKPDRVMLYPDFRVWINEVYRFDEEDTLVFHISLESQSRQPIYYNPLDFAVRIGDRIYYQSISDGAGVIPPGATVTAYFAITGSPDGSRNELSPDNKWNVLVPVIEDVPKEETIP